MLADPAIDVVSVASYDDAHFAQISAALAHGKHVFAEKPLVTDRAEADKVVALLDADPHLRLSTNVPLRLSPRFVAPARADRGRRARASCSTWRATTTTAAGTSSPTAGAGASRTTPCCSAAAST